MFLPLKYQGGKCKINVFCYKTATSVVKTDSYEATDKIKLPKRLISL